MTTTAALKALRKLTAAQIRERIDELDRERKALLALLRAAMADESLRKEARQ
jgi:hypothetical protein